MSNNASDTKEKKALKRRKKFKEQHILVKIGFILSSITLAYAIVYFIVFSVTQRGTELSLVIISATIIAMAYISQIVSSVSFSKGLNGYNVSGFVFDSIVLAAYIANFIFAIELLFQ